MAQHVAGGQLATAGSMHDSASTARRPAIGPWMLLHVAAGGAPAWTVIRRSDAPAAGPGQEVYDMHGCWSTVAGRST